jgi:2-polyprenyl-3-methyl-5-hydroxy-6-metoxy-1,4-benzoquinol methylase
MKVQQFYERYWQREYGSPADYDPTTSERKQKLKKIFERIPKESFILDAGCGNGEFSSFIAVQGYRSISIDIAEAAVRSAMQTYPRGHFHVASLDQGIPFSDNTFAAAWSSEVLEHLFDVHAVLSELNRVLQPNGLFILTVP